GVRTTELGSPAVAPAGCSAITGERPDCVTSTGSVMYVDGLTRHGGAVHEGGFAWVRSNIFTVVLLMVLATTRSEVGERMKPVVEKPSSAANPPAAASTLPLESRHTPCTSSLPCAKVQAASGVSFPHAAQEADAGRGSRSRSMGSGTMPRPASSCTCVPAMGAIANVVITAASWCGKTRSTAANAPPFLYRSMIGCSCAAAASAAALDPSW